MPSLAATARAAAVLAAAQMPPSPPPQMPLPSRQTPPPPPQMPSPPGSLLVWADEFNSHLNFPDPAKWTTLHQGNNPNSELQYYTSFRENSWVADGVLHLKAEAF